MKKDAVIDLIVVGKAFSIILLRLWGKVRIDTLARVRVTLTESSMLEVQAEGKKSLGLTRRKVKACRQPSAI